MNYRKKALIVLLAAFFIAAVMAAKEVLSDYFMRQGISSISEKNYEKAKVDFQWAGTLKPRSAELQAYLGLVALGPGEHKAGTFAYPRANYAEARDFFERALALDLKAVNDDKLYLYVLSNLGFVYLELNMPDAAIEKYLAVIERAPNSSLAARSHVSSDYIWRQNKPKEALEILLPALGMSTDRPEQLFYIYSKLALLYYYYEDFEQALSHARRAVDIAQDYDFSNNSYLISARLVAAFVHGVRGELLLARQEIEAAGKPGDLEGTLGCALANSYRLAGNHRDGLRLAQQAVLKTPESSAHYATCYQVMGETSLALGDKNEAGNFFDSYMKITDKMPKKSIFIERQRERISTMNL